MKLKSLLLFAFSFILSNAFSQKKTTTKKKVVSSAVSQQNNINQPQYDEVKSFPKKEETEKSKESIIEDKHKDIIKNNLTQIEEIEKKFQLKKAATIETQKVPQKNNAELDQQRAKLLIELLGESTYQYYNSKYSPKN